jgi:hypothetical protein
MENGGPEWLAIFFFRLNNVKIIVEAIYERNEIYCDLRKS